MSSRLVFALAAVAGLAGAGCIPVYMAPATNAPLLSSRGEIQAAGYSGTNGLDLQGAFAVTDEIGIVADISTNRRGDDSDFHTYGELGAGYFTRFGAGGRFEAFGGAGMGESGGEATWLGETIVARGTYVRGFGQADVGYCSDIVDVGLAARLAYVAYTFEKRTNGPVDANELFFEPVGFVRVGYRWVKVGAQVGLTLPMLGGEQTVDTFPLHVSLGVHTKFRGFD